MIKLINIERTSFFLLVFLVGGLFMIEEVISLTVTLNETISSAYENSTGTNITTQLMNLDGTSWSNTTQYDGSVYPLPYQSSCFVYDKDYGITLNTENVNLTFSTKKSSINFFNHNVTLVSGIGCIVSTGSLYVDGLMILSLEPNIMYNSSVNLISLKNTISTYIKIEVCCAQSNREPGVRWSVDSINGTYTVDAPDYSNNISSYPSNYSSTNATQLNVTWNDDIDSNGFNFSYIQVDSTNYTASRDGNKSYYSLVLSAGTHWWKAYANDSSDLWNSTENVSFTINNATPILSLTMSPSQTPIYPTKTKSTASETNAGDSDLTYNLYLNDTLIGTGSSFTNSSILSAGNYVYVYNTTGGANYTSNSTSLTLNISQKQPSILLNKNVKFYDGFSSTSLSSLWSSTKGTVSSTAKCNYIGDQNRSDYYTMTFTGQTGVATANSVVMDLSSESNLNLSYWYRQGASDVNEEGTCDEPESNDNFIIMYNSSDNTNKTLKTYLGSTAGSTSWTKEDFILPADAYHKNFYLIINATSTASLDVDYWAIDDIVIYGNVTSYTTTYPSTILVNGTLTNLTAVTSNLYRNHSSINNPESAQLGVGGYLYIYNTTTSDNYTSVSKNITITINKGAVQPTLAINTSVWTLTYPNATNTSCSVTSQNNEVTCLLWRNETSKTNPENILLGASTYIYKTNTSLTANYSANDTGESQTLTINPYYLSLQLVNNVSWYANYETPTNTTGYNCTSWTTCNLYRNDSLAITDNNILLGAGIYNYTYNTTCGSNCTGVLVNSSLLTINKKNASVIVYPTTQSQTYEDSPLSQYCVDNSTLLNCVIYRNETQITNNTNLTLSASVYVYKANISDSSNYTNYENTSTLTINKKNANIQVYPATQSIIYETSVNQYYTNNTALQVVKIYRNDTEINNNTNIILGVGVYTYKANITDQSNYTSYEDNETLTVTQKTPTMFLLLNNSASDTSYGENSPINITGTIDTIYDVTLYLNLNKTGFGDSFKSNAGKSVENITSTLILGTGKFNVTTHFSGDVNYTSSSDMSYLTSTGTSAPTYSNLKTSPNSPTTYYPNKVYYFNSTWIDETAVSAVLFEWNRTTNITASNQGSEYYVNRTDLKVFGSYIYKWYSNDTLNQWDSTSSYNYNVTKNSTIIYLLFNGTQGNDSWVDTSTVNITGYTNYPQQDLIFNLYNSTNLINTGITAQNLTSLSCGEHEYVYNTSGGTNYTSASAKYYVSIWNVSVGSVTQNSTLSMTEPNWLYNVSWKVELNFTNPSGFKDDVAYTYSIPSVFSPYSIQVKNSTNNVITHSQVGNYINFTTENMGTTSVKEIVYWVGMNCVNDTENQTIHTATEYSKDVTVSKNVTGYNITINSLMIDFPNDYTSVGNDFALTRNGSAYSDYSLVTTGGYYDYITINTFNLSTSYLFNVHITQKVTTTTIPSGGGGGGGLYIPPNVTQLIPQAFFVVSPTQIVMYAKPGDNRTILSQIPPTDYTYIIKNSGDNVTSIVVESQGKYSGWLKLISIYINGSWKENVSLIVNPGEEVKIKLLLTIPVSAELKDYTIPVVFTDTISGSKISTEIVIKIFGEWTDFPIYFYNKLYYPAVRFEPMINLVDWDGEYLNFNAENVLEIPFLLKIIFLITTIYLLTKLTLKYKMKVKHKWIVELMVVLIPTLLMFVW